MPGWGPIGLNAIAALDISTPLVFSSFSQPPIPKSTAHLGRTDSVIFRILRPTAATPGPAVFSSFSQPFPTKKFVDVPNVFRELRPDSATPASLVFTPFSVPSKLPQRNSDVSASFFQQPVVTPVTPVFAVFSQPARQSVRSVDNSGFFSQVPPVVPVFMKFSEPLRTTQKNSDVSSAFFIQPVVVQPTPVFSQFPDPIKTRILNPDVSSSFFVQPAAPTQVPAVFSTFGTPAKTAFQQGYVTSVGSTATQPFIFLPFDVPLLKRGISEGWITNTTPFTVTPVVVTPVFGTFSQPSPRKGVTSDFSNTSYPIVQVFPAAPSFTGFSDFASNRPRPRLLLSDQASEWLFFPNPIPPDIGFAGRTFPMALHTKKPHQVKKLHVDSSHIKKAVFDKKAHELVITFDNDKEYRYGHVSEKRAKGLENAKSAGRYFQNKIKGAYPTARIK